MTDAADLPKVLGLLSSEAKLLRIRLHHFANLAEDHAASHLLAQLNATATIFPGTDLTLVFQMVSSQIPSDQEF